MTPLRKRMIEDMRMRNFSKHTIAAYVSVVYRLAKHYRRSPDKLSREEIRAFLVDLVEAAARVVAVLQAGALGVCDFSIAMCFAEARWSRMFAVRGPRRDCQSY